MGIIKKGILGGVSGAVGNIVGANWRGIDYIRIKPSEVQNPRTELQLNQRLKFLLLIRFLQPVSEYVRIGFRSYAIRMSAFNAAFSYNYHRAIKGEYPNYEIDFPKVLLSRGNLTGVDDLAIGSEMPGVVSLTWTFTAGSGNARNSDTVMVVVYDPVLMQAVYLLNAGTRDEEKVNIAVPASFKGHTVHGYLSLMAIDGITRGLWKKSISSSQYAGSLLVP